MLPVLAVSGAKADTEALLQQLTEGGYVIYFRHAATTWPGIDNIEWPRERQRLLSDEGIQDSQRIGAAFKARSIPVGEVIASPFARCRDMAEIAFGRVEERFELLGLLSDSQGRQDRIDYMQQKASALTEPGKNRVIVAHRSNISAVAPVSLGEGDAVVLKPNGSGFEVLGIIPVDEW